MESEHWSECDGMRWINGKTRLARYPDKYRLEQLWSGGIDSIDLSVDELKVLVGYISGELEGLSDIRRNG